MFHFLIIFCTVFYHSVVLQASLKEISYYALSFSLFWQILTEFAANQEERPSKQFDLVNARWRIIQQL
jgi:hypothetical protein